MPAHATSEACPAFAAAALTLAPSAAAGRSAFRPAGWDRTSQVSVRAVYALVVEPDTVSRALLVGRLRQEHLEVQTASGAEEALTETVRCGAPAVVVAEIDLPGIDGFGLCERLRAEHRTAEVPVFLLAHAPRPEHRRKALAAGADDYFPMPVFADDLAARVALECGRLSNGTFTATAESLPLPQLVRALLSGSSSGCLELADRRGALAFHNRRVVSCRFEAASGADGVERLLALGSGAYQVRFGPVEPGPLSLGLEELCGEILPRLRRWSRLASSGVPLDARLEVLFAELPRWLPSLPHDIHRLLSLLDGRRTVRAVIADAPYPEVTTLEVLTRLYALGVVGPSADGAKLSSPPPRAEAPKPQASSPSTSALLNETVAPLAYLPDRFVSRTALFLIALAGTAALVLS